MKTNMLDTNVRYNLRKSLPPEHPAQSYMHEVYPDAYDFVYMKLYIEVQENFDGEIASDICRRMYNGK